MKRLFFAVLLMATATSAMAVSSYLTSFNTKYGTSATVLNTCLICHNASATGGRLNSRNPYGAAWENAGGDTAAYASIEPQDSDGDSFTNIVEITARTFPGNATSFPIVVKTPNAPTNLNVQPVQ
jgi:hypothetical protein